MTATLHGPAAPDRYRPQTKLSSGWDELTARERDVLRLMADGLSNVGISTTLFLSAKTVEVHIGSIFGKLGLARLATENRRVRAVLMCIDGSLPGRDPYDRQQTGHIH